MEKPTKEQFKALWAEFGYKGVQFKQCPDFKGLDAAKSDPEGLCHVEHYEKGERLTDNDYPDWTIDNIYKIIMPVLEKKGWMLAIQHSPLYDDTTGKQIADWIGVAQVYYVANDKKSVRGNHYMAMDNDIAIAAFRALWWILKERKTPDDNVESNSK